MRKLYYILYLLTAVLVSSCLHEEDDLFDGSSANRADAMIEAHIAVLTGASNGWHMEYFPAYAQEYGGYSMLLSFGRDGKVNVAGDIVDPDDVATSLYSVKQSAGILLSFDTQNEIFHFFADPSDPAGVSQNGIGLEGDYDFLILEASAEKIVLKGKKTGGTAILTPMQGDWSSFIEEIQDAHEAMDFIKYEIEIGGEVISVVPSFRTLAFTYNEGVEKKTQTASYIVTKTGYKFYAPIEIKGITLSGFTFDYANKWFTEINNPGIKLIPIVPPLNEQLILLDWYITQNGLGSFARPYFSFVISNYLNPNGLALNYAYLGSSMYGKYGFNFNCSGYTGLLTLNYSLIGDEGDKVSLEFAWAGEGYGVTFHNNFGFNYMLEPFGYSAPRIFTLTTDNIDSPTFIRMVEDANPDNTITLYKEQQTYLLR